MALFTGKGDDGTTYFFGSKCRFNKDTPLAEALGTLDELGSLLGFVKIRLGLKGPSLKGSQGRSLGFSEILEEVQQNLFIIQAELAGADNHIVEAKVKDMEATINAIEKKLSPITTFFLSGANEQSSLLDFARTVSRRAERRVVHSTRTTRSGQVAPNTLAYLNRLSSLLYALARLSAQSTGKLEKKPTYE